MPYNPPMKLSPGHRLLDDPVHKYRSESGIELIHKEPSSSEKESQMNDRLVKNAFFDELQKIALSPKTIANAVEQRVRMSHTFNTGRLHIKDGVIDKARMSSYINRAKADPKDLVQSIQTRHPNPFKGSSKINIETMKEIINKNK